MQTMRTHDTRTNIALARRRANAVVPIFKLSIEVLSSIFLSIQLDYRTRSLEDEQLNDIDGELPVELTLCHVCSCFRDVAIGTPSMWSNIKVLPSTCEDRVFAYISRSRSCPLIITFDFSEHTWQQVLTERALDALFSQINRWSRCSIVEAGHIAERLVHLSAPHLQHLTICISDLEHSLAGTRRQTAQVITGGCPELISLHLYGLALTFFRPPIAKVDTLSIDQTRMLSLEFPLFAQLLTSSPTLTNLSIHGDVLGLDIPWPTTELIEMPALRTLRLGGTGGAVYSGLLLCISAPALESLTLRGFHDEDLDPVWEQFSVSQPFPCLHSLSLCDFEMPENRYHKLFRIFPHIKAFASSHHCTFETPKVLYAIGNPSDVEFSHREHQPWPDLETLFINIDFDEQWMLRELLVARKRRGHSLTKLGIFTNDVTTLRDFENLEDLVQVEMYPYPELPWAEGQGFGEDVAIPF